MSVHLAQTFQYEATTTRYLVRNNYDDIWWCSLPRSLLRIRSANPQDLPVRDLLEPSDLFPTMTPGTLEYEGCVEDPTIFIKHSNFLHVTHFYRNLTLYRDSIALEMRVCESLAREHGWGHASKHLSILGRCVGRL